MPLNAIPLVCGPAKLNANLLKVAGLTVTLKRSDPLVVTEPSVATTEADSTLYKLMLTVATPLLKVTLVAVPKLVPATVGLVAGLEDAFAPLKVIDLAPVYPVAVLPLASFAVIVMFWLAPAVCVPVPVTMNLLADPAPIVTFPLVTAVPLAGVNVKVPVPAVPVYIKLLTLATPLLKSPAPLNLVVPDKPEMVPLKLVVTVILLALASKPVTVLP